MRKILLTSLLLTALPAAVGLSPAMAAPDKPLKCLASDPADVVVNSAADSVAITDDPSTGGNNFGCFTNLSVTAGDTITFNHTATCGGGVPRVFVRFAGGASENTFDTGTCTDGAVTYTLVNSGRIKSFAFINDRGDGGTVAYSGLIIGGNVIDF